MANPTYSDLHRLRREIDALMELSTRKHLGRGKQAELDGLIRRYKAMRSYLDTLHQQLEDAEFEAIRASKRAKTQAERSEFLDEVNRIRREQLKLLGEI